MLGYEPKIERGMIERMAETKKSRQNNRPLEGTVVREEEAPEDPVEVDSPEVKERTEEEFQRELKSELDADLSAIGKTMEKEELRESEDDPYLPVPSQATDYLTSRPSKDLDPLSHYIRQIGRYELLSPEKEKALAKALSESGDIEAAKQLVVSNLRLVVKIAMEYRYTYPNVMDLIQEGNIGLMKAVSKYDLTKGAKLSYYASWWIRSYILKFILDNFRLVKIGTTNEQKKLFYNLLKEKDRLLSIGIEPDTKTISENLGVSEKSVEVMSKRLGPAGGEVSIDKPLASDDSGRSTYGDLLPANLEGNDIEQQLVDAQSLDILKTHLKGFLEQLKPRDREIFKQRLLSEVPPSLQSIADEYGVSRERVRQIEERLLKNLKVYMSEYFS